METNDDLFDSLRLLLIGIVVILIMIFMVREIRPVLLNMETEAVRNSTGYVEARIVKTRELMTKYEGLKINMIEASTPDLKDAYQRQLLGLVDDIWAMADEIPSNLRPERLRGWLDTHPR